MSEESQITVLAPKTVEPTMEVLRYKEELAAKMGLPSPYGMTIMKELAKDLVESGMVPRHWNNNPMAVYGAALRGREMGMQPMESIFEAFWPAPGGNLGMYAKKMLQLMHKGGVTSEFLKEDVESCEILFTPPVPHIPYTARFHISEAKDAKLVKDDSNWAKWRTDMNRARAISRGWRALSGTFQGGLNGGGLYSKEEMEDTGMLDSSVGEPSESDQRRTEVLAAQEAKYHVAVKVKPVEPTAEQVKESPKVEAQEPDKPAQPNVATKPIEYEVWAIMTNGSGEPKPLLCSEPKPTNDKASAVSMAQAQSNETGLPHQVVMHNPNTNERTNCDLLKPTVKPVEITTKAKPETRAKSPEVNAFKARLVALAKVMGLVEKTALSRFGLFLAGYTGYPTVADFKASATTEVKYAALEELEAMIHAGAAREMHDEWNEFGAGFEESGKRRHRWAGEIQKFLEGKWPKHPDCISLGRKLARAWQLEPRHFEKWFESQDLDFLPIESVTPFLRVLLRTRRGIDLMKACKSLDQPIWDIVDQIETKILKGKLEDSNVGEIESAITQFVELVKGKPVAASTPVPAPIVAEEPPAAEEDTNLFEGQW